MKKINFGLIALCLLPLMSFGAVRTAEQAAVLAKKQAAKVAQAAVAAQEMKLVHQCTKLESDEPAFYVFNKADKSGFVIVSGDDRTEDVLGYSDEGAFDPDNVNPNLQFWLDLLQEAISAANETNIHKAPQATSAMAIGPLLTNKEGKEILWGQGTPYNKLCPTDAGGRCLTGCVATSAAMVMYHWAYPETGIGKSSYRWNGQTLSADYENTTYDWEHMLPSYWGRTSTEQQKTAVATLMYHAGVASEMEYGSDGSGTYTDYMAQGLVNHFGYHVDKFITSYPDWYNSDFEPTEYNVSIEKFIEYFNADLEEGRPIIMGGQDRKNGGHEFICDGRNAKGQFHINWGWEGDGNGYFSLDALKIDGYNFSAALDAIMGLCPALIDTVHVTSVSLSPKEATLKINEKISLEATIKPQDATIKRLIWTSSDLNVAKVTSEGVVRGLGTGQALITVTTKDGNYQASCQVTVTDEFVPSDVFDYVSDMASLQEGDDIIIEADYNNAHYCATDIMNGTTKTTYTTCEQVQIVDNSISLPETSNVAVFKLGKQDGAWTLMNTSGQKLSAVGDKKLNLDLGTVTWMINIDEEGAVIASTDEECGCLYYNNNNNDPRFCIYTSKPGASAVPNIYARFNSKPVKVVKVTGIELGQTYAQMIEGEEIFLYYAVKPVSATNQSVMWSSSDEAVVKVDPNKTSIEDSKTVAVQAVSEGQAVITAKTLDGGFVASCTVVVTKEPIVPEDTVYVTASEAKAIAEQLPAGDQTTDFYGVKGYVTFQNTADYLGFWLDDAKTENETFQGFQCKMPQDHLYLQKGEYVCLYGYIMNYNNEKMQIKNGTVEVLQEPSDLRDLVPDTRHRISSKPYIKVFENGRILFVGRGSKFNALGVRLR